MGMNYALTDDQIGPLLESLGYEYVSGYGPTAVWRTPKEWRDKDGKAIPQAPIAQLAAANDEFKDQSPYTQQPSRGQQQVAPDRTAQVGIDSEGRRRYFTIDRNGFTQWGADAPPDMTGAATGMQVGLGYSQLGENKRQFDITTQQRAEQQKLEYDLALKKYEQSQQQINDARAVNAANMLFAQNKEAFAQSSQNKQLALHARGQLMQERQAALDLQVRQSTLDQQWSQFNATMQQRVAEQNQDFETKRRDRLAGIATQAGTLAQDAGDRGKLAATMLANSGWGGASKALTGENYITEESLTPLESLLRTRQEVAGQASPYTFTPTERPERLQMPVLPDLSAMMQGVQTSQTVGGSIPGATSVTGVGPVTYQPGVGYVDSGGNAVGSSNPGSSLAGQLTGMGANPESAAAWGAMANKQAGVPAAAHGGRMDGAYISGERGPEINIPLGDGQTLVLNQQQASKMGLDLRKMMENGQPNYQAGGIFSGAFENVTDADRSLSRDFVEQAGQRALAGTPWAGGNLPGPVYLSSPSIDPITSQLIGSLKAIREGVPAQATQYYAGLYRPTGMRESVTGRSR